LRIPALCGELTKTDAQNVLNISAFDTEEIVGSRPSLIKQRREILPNPGSLDKINADDKKQNLVLIPGAKKRSKTLVKPDISIDCNKKIVPLIDLEKQSNESPKMEVYEGLQLDRI